MSGLTAKFEINEKAIARVKARLHEKAEHSHPHRASVGIHAAEGGAQKIGYDGQPGHDTLAQVAMEQEFGTGNIPARSFLRAWFDQNLDRNKQQMADVMRAEYLGDHEAVRRQVELWAMEMQGMIGYGESLAPLSPVTVARKTHANLASPSTPVFATGQLLRAIKAAVDGATA